MLVGFLTTRFSVIIYTGATEDDDDDAESHLGGESQVMLDICDNAYVDVDEEETPVLGKDAETSGFSARRPEPTREKTAADKHGFEAPGMPLGPISATDNMVSQKVERVSPAALVVDLTASPEKSARAPRLEDAKLPGVTGSRGNIPSRAAGSSEAQQPTAAAPARPADNIRANLAPPSNTAVAPTTAAADEGIVSNVGPPEAKLPSVAAAEGARKESTSARNTMLVGKTTNDIQSGRTETTFSAFDLPLPARKKSKKKRKA